MKYAYSSSILLLHLYSPLGYSPLEAIHLDSMSKLVKPSILQSAWCALL